jgi:hypothetical protein
VLYYYFAYCYILLWYLLIDLQNANKHCWRCYCWFNYHTCFFYGVMVEAQNKVVRGRQRTAVGGNNIKTLLARRRAATRNLMLLLRPTAAHHRPRAALFCASTITKLAQHISNNVYLHFASCLFLSEKF